MRLAALQCGKAVPYRESFRTLRRCASGTLMEAQSQIQKSPVGKAKPYRTGQRPSRQSFEEWQAAPDATEQIRISINQPANKPEHHMTNKMTRTSGSAYDEKLAWYEKLVATNPSVKRKGDTMPYTSL